MRKVVTEKDILAFTYEFVRKVCEIDETLLYGDYVMRFGKRELELDCATPSFGYTLEELPDCTNPAEYHVREYDSDEDHECIAYLGIEGDLYELLYYYEAYGYGGEKAEELWWDLVNLSDKYGMVYVWSGGAIAFYDAEEYRLS